MMPGIEVKNTICFDFEDGSARPTLDEIANFVKMLDADAAEMEATYRLCDEKAIYIKFKREEPMLYALRHNSDKLDFHYADGKIIKVTMSLAGGNVQYVRVYGLPPEIPENTLAMVLGKYGNVKRVVREKFPVELGLNMTTGVRGVYMDVQKEIPSSLHFHNRKGNIFYEGNQNQCFLCKLEGHRMNACPNRKARKQEKRQEKKEQTGSTYAGAVARGATTLAMTGEAVIAEAETEGTQLDDSHPETIEVLEEDTSESAMEPTAVEISEDGANNEATRNHPWHQLAVQVTSELKRRTEELERKEEREQRRQAKKGEEETKIKSPPVKKKKNYSLYTK